jgi:hypothetical protein
MVCLFVLIFCLIFDCFCYSRFVTLIVYLGKFSFEGIAESKCDITPVVKEFFFFVVVSPSFLKCNCVCQKQQLNEEYFKLTSARRGEDVLDSKKQKIQITTETRFEQNNRASGFSRILFAIIILFFSFALYIQHSFSSIFFP